MLHLHLLELGVSKAPSNTSDLLSVIIALSDVLSTLNRHVANFLELFIVFYLQFCATIDRIINKGVVNAIPSQVIYLHNFIA